MGALSQIPAPWLDVTRTLTRLGRRAPTGIDRVELEYLKAFLNAGCDRFLCRTTRGYLLLDDVGGRLVVDLAEERRALGQADLLSRLTFRAKRSRHKAEAALRAVAIDRCRPGALPALLARAAPDGWTYLNVGHSNLSEATLSAFAAGGQSMVMIHDLIPITHPDLVADDQPANFAGRVERVRRYTSHVIANSHATAEALDLHWHGADRRPETIVAHLGVPVVEQMAGTRDPLHFVMLGTIEPRKNHALIVDAWEALAQELPPEDMPQLHIIGHTGWKVEALMQRLHSHPLRGQSIHLHGPLSDEDVHTHLSKATALLFPSITEGFGFPPLEAAMVGATPICSDLPVFRETLGDCVVYVNNPTAYQWKETIKQLIDGKIARPDLSKVKCPTWQEHFEIVADAVITTDPSDRT
ncbi:glycosyltransferase family 4 protein [Gymnodinialimonas hymeniacidonis]|uniref:glycosyltransferase family 4 protein n=1 Tax=Gymnodinialimonas hymeniacidonis TaxID=3126508 RepID=UPI0034C67DFB